MWSCIETLIDLTHYMAELNSYFHYHLIQFCFLLIIWPVTCKILTNAHHKVAISCFWSYRKSPNTHILNLQQYKTERHQILTFKRLNGWFSITTLAICFLLVNELTSYFNTNVVYALRNVLYLHLYIYFVLRTTGPWLLIFGRTFRR